MPLAISYASLLLPGQTHDMTGVAPLIEDISFEALLADKAFDADWLLQELNARGATVVIPPKANRTVRRDYDTEVYKWRHMVENYFAKIKEFRGIAPCVREVVRRSTFPLFLRWAG